MLGVTCLLLAAWRLPSPTLFVDILTLLGCSSLLLHTGGRSLCLLDLATLLAYDNSIVYSSPENSTANTVWNYRAWFSDGGHATCCTAFAFLRRLRFTPARSRTPNAILTPMHACLCLHWMRRGTAATLYLFTRLPPTIFFCAMPYLPCFCGSCVVTLFACAGMLSVEDLPTMLTHSPPLRVSICCLKAGVAGTGRPGCDRCRRRTAGACWQDVLAARRRSFLSLLPVYVSAIVSS